MQPSNTLYVNRLNEKIKIPELKECLFEIFSEHGVVLDIVADSSYKRQKRGQAFVAFQEIKQATMALKSLNGANFLGQKLNIAFANSKSDVIAKKDGTYKPRPRGKTRDEITQEKKKKKASGPSFKEMPETTEKPSAKLICTELPAEVNEMMLKMLFQQYPGLSDVNHIPSRKVAFVSFQNEMQSGTALQGLKGFMLDEKNALNVTYAKE